MNRLEVLTRLRSIARKTGVLRLLSRFRGLGSRAYEARFDAALAGAIQPGDHVWDVGANVGHYTERFADRVGPRGSVVAFEPVPACFDVLTRRMRGRPSVMVRREALGASEGVVPMRLAEDPLGATHSLVGGLDPGGSGLTIDVPLRTGDAVWKTEGLQVPNVVKIDVEGFEEDVLRGMSEILANPSCRAIFIEVHFALLEARGTPNAPSRIVDTLTSRGFRTRWLDSSHLMARR